MMGDNMRSAAFPPHIPRDVPVPLFDLAAKGSSRRLRPDAPTALRELESEGAEGRAVNRDRGPLMGRCAIARAPVL